ncbi:MAG TPA: Type 1 glutamine amidotransferase-like domain-containing protein [Candidatus Acidoferrum sp.]|nr:Type 1 glutamine amidotransferase-like domain-containing protein [Candidatus Acidoferrum sp.]
MPILYLIGGENVFKRSAREVNERAFQNAGKPLNVLVFSWARASFDNSYKKRKKLVDYFMSLGADSISFVDFSDSNEVIAKKMADSNLVYLTGGLPTILLERLKKMSVDHLLHDYCGVIVGRSAGALALCRKCVITCRSSLKSKIIDGLGLVNITLKVHYEPEKGDTLKTLSKKDTIYALPEGSAIIYNIGVCSFIGNVYLFQEGQMRTLQNVDANSSQTFESK